MKCRCLDKVQTIVDLDYLQNSPLNPVEWSRLVHDEQHRSNHAVDSSMHECEHRQVAKSPQNHDRTPQLNCWPKINQAIQKRQEVLEGFQRKNRIVLTFLDWFSWLDFLVQQLSNATQCLIGLAFMVVLVFPLCLPALTLNQEPFVCRLVLTMLIGGIKVSMKVRQKNNGSVSMWTRCSDWFVLSCPYCSLSNGKDL
jgi:hypothetical protein